MIDHGELQSALWASLKRVLIGLAVGLLAGLVLAVFAGTFRRAQDLVDSSMQVVKAIPTFALVPLLIIWLGIYEGPKVTLIALSAGWPIYFNTFGGIRDVDERLVEAGRSLGLGRVGLLRHIIVPGSLPGFLVGLRISLANAWLALVIAEEINANNGLGRLLADARSAARLDKIVLVIVVYAVLGLLSYGLVLLLEARLLEWRRGYEAT
jgi:sulfonate transport system permease protein